MPLRSSVGGPWVRGVSLIAITYVYFLIFAQFAFLHRLAGLGITGPALTMVMTAMAVGGILFSLLPARLQIFPSPALRLRIGLGISSAAAFFSLLPLSVTTAGCVAFLIGSGLGILTVTLVANLRSWIGERHALFYVGLGTGAGYFACNFPPLFTASPNVQSIVAGALCLAALCLPLSFDHENQPCESLPIAKITFFHVLAGFAALVWLDSAAFLIIQNTPALRAGTWQGSIHLSTNAFLHLAAALLSAWLLRKRGLALVLGGAVVALGGACLLLLSPPGTLLASILYPIGVSLYSVALVAYPSFLAPAETAVERTRQAGWIYAIAGWGASVLGIGMAQNLGHVPPAFVGASALVILLPSLVRLVLRRQREAALTAAILIAALVANHFISPASVPPASRVELGRQVYISEGCISCHSQYVRPNSPDVLMWGPVESIEKIRLQHPPLIGNRRQGPDLSNVGSRRSALWLKMHLYHPAQVSGASIMPPYGFLFRDERGEDLVAYLAGLHGSGVKQQIAEELLWQPSAVALQRANAADGQRLYIRYCATCHDSSGSTRRAWQSKFNPLPPDLAQGSFQHVPASATSIQRWMRLAQIAKFGVPGTDMPGHEYLPDEQISSISLWVLQHADPSAQFAQKQ